MIQILVTAVKNNRTDDIYEFDKSVYINPFFITALKPSLMSDHVDVMMSDGMAYRVKETDPQLLNLIKQAGRLPPPES